MWHSACLTLSQSDTLHNYPLSFWWVSSCWVSHFIYCYAECHYGECHYGECCVFLWNQVLSFLPKYVNQKQKRFFIIGPLFYSIKNCKFLLICLKNCWSLFENFITVASQLTDIVRQQWLPALCYRINWCQPWVSWFV